MRRLPALPSPALKWPAGLASFVVAALAYAIASRWGVERATFLPLTFLDQLIPFVPATVWIYLSAFLLLPIAFHQSRDLRLLHKNLYAFVGLCLLSAAIFVVFPVAYPREAFPLPGLTQPWTRMLFEFLRAVDSPGNCLPSLHAGVAFLMILNARRELGRHDPRLLVWCTLLIFSTLTTKQHYVFDLLAGMALAWGVHRFFHDVARYEEPSIIQQGLFRRDGESNENSHSEQPQPD